jgi:outer membrane protein assembly factor BamA
MITQTKYILILLLLPFQFNLPQTIREIGISGNTVYGDGEIRDWIGINEGSQYFAGILDTMKSRVAANLVSHGYLHSLFINSELQFSADSQNVKVFLNVDERKPTIIKSVFISTEDSLLKENYTSTFRYLEGEIINKIEIETNINQILGELENSGYPFAAVKIKSVHLYDDSLADEHFADLYLILTEGTKSNIEKIEIDGNSST